MRQHFIRLSGTPNNEGFLRPKRLCTSTLKVENIVKISIQTIQIYFDRIEDYEEQWEIQCNLVNEVIWLNNNTTLEDAPMPIANLLVTQKAESRHFFFSVNKWFDVSERDQFLKIRLWNPISDMPIRDQLFVYLVIGITTC